MTRTVWHRHGITMSWCDDCYGKPEMALYLGNLCIGNLMELDHPNHPGTSWRPWIMTDDDGKSLGWFAAEQEARDVLVEAAIKALVGGGE